jgi:hypothetical protein
MKKNDMKESMHKASGIIERAVLRKWDRAKNGDKMMAHIVINGEPACEVTLSSKDFGDWRTRFRNFPQCWHDTRAQAEKMADQYRYYFKNVKVVNGNCQSFKGGDDEKIEKAKKKRVKS